MEDLELKIKNAPEIIFRTNQIVICDANIDSAEHPAITGMMFAEGRYGFKIIVETDIEKFERTYPTQCSISGIQEVNGILNIWEQHKYPSSWKFKKDGKYLSHAIFDGIWLPELEFLYQLGIVKVKPLRDPNYSLPDFDKKAIELINSGTYLGEPETIKLAKPLTKTLSLNSDN